MMVADMTPGRVVVDSVPPPKIAERQHRIVFVTTQPSVDRGQTKREALGVLQTYLTLWLLFELATVGFVLAYLLIVNFAWLESTPSCSAGMVNPSSGQSQGRFSLQVYGGFSSSSSSCGDGTFCIHWTDVTAWQRFVSASASGNPFQSYPDTTSALSSVQALVPCALVFLLLAISTHAYLYCKPTGHGPSSAVWLYHLATWSLLLAWVLALVAQSELLFAPPFSPAMWTTFFRRGYTLADLVQASPPSEPTAEQRATASGCFVALSFDGGTWLSVSVGFLFVILWFSIIAGCCIGPLLVAAAHSDSA